MLWDKSESAHNLTWLDILQKQINKDNRSPSTNRGVEMSDLFFSADLVNQQKDCDLQFFSVFCIHEDIVQILPFQKRNQWRKYCCVPLSSGGNLNAYFQTTLATLVGTTSPSSVNWKSNCLYEPQTSSCGVNPKVR